MASSYASSTLSQDLLSSHDSQSTRDDEGSSVAGGGAGSIAYSQADRLRRASLSLSDTVSAFDYKSQEGNWRDDEERSQYSTTSGVTDY